MNLNFRYIDSGVLSISHKWSLTVCLSDTGVNSVTGNWAESHASSICSEIVKHLRSKYTRLQVSSELPNSLWFSKIKRKDHESRIHCLTPFSWIIFLFTAVGMIQRNDEKQWKCFMSLHSFMTFIHCMVLSCGLSTGTCRNLSVYTTSLVEDTLVFTHRKSTWIGCCVQLNVDHTSVKINPRASTKTVQICTVFRRNN